MSEIGAEENEAGRIGILIPDMKLQHVLDAMPFWVLLVDSSHNIIAVNRAAKQEFGLGLGQMNVTQCPLILNDNASRPAECPLVEASQRGESVERDVFDSEHDRWLRLSVYPTPMVTIQGQKVYLHLASDITQSKRTADSLSRSLEHHTALCKLLQDLQYCQGSMQILEVLIDEITSLSWLGVSTTAVGFLLKDQYLEMSAYRNLTPKQLRRCRRLELGECLCGKAAQTGQPIVCSSNNSEHNIRFDSMAEHRHVILPISYEDRVLGVLTLYFKAGDELDNSRLDFLKAATAAAGAALAEQLAREAARRIREKSVAKIISGQEDERKRIAAELHDQVCQSLSAVLMDVQSHGLQNESIREMAQECSARIRSLIDEVREMAMRLRPTILDDYGLESALSRHIEELSILHKDPQIDFQFVSPQNQELRLPSQIETCLYRVAREALANIVSHAEASRASVILLKRSTKVLLLIEDDGRGFDYSVMRKDIDRCLGLIDMEERVLLLGGTLKIESTPQKGTTIRAEIPLWASK